jgi:hypothetical protein
MFTFVLTAAAGISVLAAGCLTPNRVDAADEKIRDWLVARHVVDASYHGCHRASAGNEIAAPGGITVASR